MTNAARFRNLAVSVLVSAAAVAAGGCGAGTPVTPAADGHGQPGQGQHAGHDLSDTSTEPPAPAKPAKPMTVRQLAGELGCQAKLTGKAADFRQAMCLVDGEQFVLLDFDTAQGQRDWLEMSEMYGGVYLVGDRWALSGNSKEHMVKLSEQLGGTVEEGDTH